MVYTERVDQLSEIHIRYDRNAMGNVRRRITERRGNGVKGDIRSEIVTQVEKYRNESVAVKMGIYLLYGPCVFLEYRVSKRLYASVKRGILIDLGLKLIPVRNMLSDVRAERCRWSKYGF